MKSTRSVLIICGILIITTIIIVFNPKPSESKSNATYSTALSASQLNDMLKNKDFALINLEVNDKKYLKNTDYEAPYNELSSIEEYLKTDLNKKVVFYSRDGSQSAITVNDLRKKGYKNSYYLEGGMDSWVKSGYETTEDLNIDMSNIKTSDNSMMNMRRFNLDEFKEIMKSFPPVKDIGQATKEEVFKHNTLEDCWVIVEEKVYNLPYYWTAMHPGGQEIYIKACGTDITKEFSAHTTEKPSTVLQYFYIGELTN